MPRISRKRDNSVLGRGAIRVALLAPLFCIMASGCSSGSWDWMRSRKSMDYYLDLALDGRTPDERRRGVNGLAESPDATSDDAIRVFDAIARTDTDAMVRVAAVRGLGKSADARSVETAIKLLGSVDVKRADVRPAPPAVRWESAKLLFEITDQYTYEESQREAIVRVLLERVKQDRDRNVRLAAIDTLAYFAERPVPSVLIDVLDTSDFAVQHTAEKALIALTGVTQGHDSDAWRAWLAETKDPFEHAGETPPELVRKEDKPWWKL
ncbi:MAG: HEAT repeat domain-containing protein [Planctomycetota bacterium]|nr:HEAT repeat domain-containing protein [Planctomycetota bacterium]